ncbi:hypothetical protein D3C86_1425160 [compost metagenome]
MRKRIRYVLLNTGIAHKVLLQARCTTLHFLQFAELLLQLIDYFLLIFDHFLLLLHPFYQRYHKFSIGNAVIVIIISRYMHAIEVIIDLFRSLLHFLCNKACLADLCRCREVLAHMLFALLFRHIFSPGFSDFSGIQVIDYWS